MEEGNHPLNPQDPMSDQSTHDDGLTSSHAHSLCPTVNDSTEYTAKPRPMIKYTEGIHFDLQRITGLLASLDPNQQCAALQLLNHAAEWESTNFNECVSVTFGPVVELLLDSKNIQVHCAALDTLKLFLVSPNTVDIIKPMMTFILYAVLNDLNSPQQSASIELINAATQSKEILVEFAPAISRLSTLLSSMPAATQVIALRVLEVSAASNMRELIKAVTNTFLSLIHPLLSPETTVQTAALKVIEASVGTKTREVSLAAVILLHVLARTLRSGETDAQSAARKVLEQVDFESFIPSAAITKPELLARGSGGLSGVWKCSMSTPSETRIVIVKYIRVPQSGDKDILYKISKRVHREAYVWMQLSHDHILPLEGITDSFGELPALVSLWMENGTLNDYLKREFPQLTDLRKSELIQQVAAGVFYLHGKDIVHGDLSGRNILVDGPGNIRITGFGSSMLLAEADNEMFSTLNEADSETETLTVSSTLPTWNMRWTAPEFLLPLSESDEELPLNQPTKLGDIYSFGCVMLQVRCATIGFLGSVTFLSWSEILSGREPYGRITNTMHILGAIQRGFGPFRGVEINMNETHRDLSSQCLSREPKQRPSIVEVTNIVGPPDSDKSFLHGDATGQQLEHSDPILERFFDDDSRHDPGHPPPSSLHHAFFGRFSLPFRKKNGDVPDMQTRPSPMDWARKLFSGKPVDRNDESLELLECRPTVVDVSSGRAADRYATKRGVLAARKKDKERTARIAAEGKEKKAKIAAEKKDMKAKIAAEKKDMKAKIAAEKAAGASSRLRGNDTQQSDGAAHPPSSQPHVAVHTSSATPAVTTTSAGAASTTPLPDVTMRQDGCWTHFWFWPYLCCTCADSTNGHH